MKLCLVCNFQFGDEQELCPKDYSKLVPLGKDQLVGKVIQDRYRIDSTIAKGSMGIVYKATQELIGREVAVKVLHSYLVADEESLKRFHKEAKAASRLNHPNITTLYDYGVLSSGQPYIVMDLLRGKTLADILKERDYLPFDEAMSIFKQVCDALAEAHKRGVVHRDMKPENIVIENTDKGVYVKVVDFGIAKFLQEAEDTIGKITKTGTVCGSPTYMSPEQCDDGTVDHRSDIYSLGVVFYESITGKVPFSGTDIYHVMTMHVKEPPPRLRFTRPDLDFPAHMEQVIEKVLAKDPDARYQSVDDLWEALKGRPGDRTRSPGTQIPAPRTGELPALTGAAGKSVSEAEVAGVVSKALQKRMSGNPDLLAGQPPVPSAQPAVASATEEGGRIPTSALAVVSNRTSPEPSRMRAGVSLLDRVVGTWQAAAPALLTILLSAALLWVVANETLIHSLIDQNIKPMFAHTKTPPDAQSPESLIEKGKLEQARAILEKHKKGGHLSPAEADLLDTVYVRLARKEAQQKHFKNAVSLLEKVGGDASGSDEVKSLLKKYRKAAGR